MNNIQKRKANLAAAKLIGYEMPRIDPVTDKVLLLSGEYEQPCTMHKQVCHDGRYHRLLGELDIFTNPADCLGVVKVLGASHAHSIQYYAGHDGKHGWYVEVDCNTSISGVFDTYEEAVAEACLKIGENDVTEI